MNGGQMIELAYLNGKFMPIGEATVSIEDRGYQFGDAVYEVISCKQGKPFAMEQHMDRLYNSMDGLDFPYVDRTEIKNSVQTLAEKSQGVDSAVYIQISRCACPRNHLIPEEATPNIIMTLRENKSDYSRQREQGVKVITTADIRWGRCDIKTVQLLPNILAKKKAVDQGAFDAVFLGDGGIVREATSSNLLICKDGVVKTHPLTPIILPGITRYFIVKICDKLGIEFREEEFTLEQMLIADEVFLAGTITEILPVVSVDGAKIGDGSPGPISQKIFAQLLTLMQ